MIFIKEEELTKHFLIALVNIFAASFSDLFNFITETQYRYLFTLRSNLCFFFFRHQVYIANP